MFVEKPWGGYEEHYRAPDLSVCYKTLYIEPGHQLSAQYHHNRAEMWYISDTNALFQLTLGEVNSGNIKSIRRGINRIDIPRGYLHTIKNMSSLTLLIYETQYGKCEENDVVRVYDPYNRT